MSRHYVGPQSLKTACPHLTEVAMQNTHVEKRRAAYELEELDVVATVESCVNVNSKFHLLRSTYFST